MKNERITFLTDWCKEKIKHCPKLRTDIIDLLNLALMEIEDGSSVEHQIELCMSDVEELIKENCN